MQIALTFISEMHHLLNSSTAAFKGLLW